MKNMMPHLSHGLLIVQSQERSWRKGHVYGNESEIGYSKIAITFGVTYQDSLLNLYSVPIDLYLFGMLDIDCHSDSAQ